nr:hypothetical protein [Photorhabdus bodei]
MTGIVKGMKFSIFFSAAYRTVELMFKDEYTLADFLGNIAVDLAKAVVVAFVSWVVGSVMISTSVFTFGIIVVAGIVFGIGVLTVYILDSVDKKFRISETIINLLKEEIERKPRTPEANFNQFLNNWGSYGK